MLQDGACNFFQTWPSSPGESDTSVAHSCSSSDTPFLAIELSVWKALILSAKALCDVYPSQEPQSCTPKGTSHGAKASETWQVPDWNDDLSLKSEHAHPFYGPLRCALVLPPSTGALPATFQAIPPSGLLKFWISSEEATMLESLSLPVVYGMGDTWLSNHSHHQDFPAFSWWLDWASNSTWYLTYDMACLCWHISVTFWRVLSARTDHVLFMFVFPAPIPCCHLQDDPEGSLQFFFNLLIFPLLRSKGWVWGP